MSTLSGVNQKGEKGKSKFQSLDINSLYGQTNRGESSEPHQTKNAAPRRHGMQALGKVPSTRRPPANLPSLKSEHSGNDPSVSLVPTGGTGWGSKPGETGPSPASQPPSQTSSTPTSANANSTPPTHGSSAPAAAGIGMPATSTNIPPQTQATQPPPMMKPIVGSSGDKTWSSVTGGDSGPSFLAHQSPQFQQEFPSLSGEGAGQGPPGGGGGGGKGSGSAADAQYGPGPSLRPQTEGSWICGGTQLRPGQIGPPSHPPQHPYLPQEIVGVSQSGGASRASSGLFGVGAGPGGLSSSGAPLPSAPPLSSAAPLTSAPPIPSTFKHVMPDFFPKSAGFSAFPPPTTTSSSNSFQNNIRLPRFNANFPEMNNRYNSSRHADAEDLTPRPIIRKEDLTRMDEISRDAGWTTQNDIDYDQQIAFSDEESTGVEDEKDITKEKSRESDKREDNRREIESDKDSKDVGKPNDRLNSNDKQPRSNRGPSSGSVEFRQYSRPSHAMVSENEEDHWSEKRRQTSENIKLVTEKAKQRKEEEEKKFEESRPKTIADNDKLKVKKEDDSRHSSASPITDWDHGDSKGGMMSHPPPPNKESLNDSGGNNFRQMTQIESRNDNMRDRFRNDRMDSGRGFNGPRFQKHRGPPNSNSYDGGQNRWSNSNSHGPMSNFPVKSGSGVRRGPDMGNDMESDRFLHKEDKGRMHNDERERYRPNTRNDGAHDSNRKTNYYEGSFDYNRPHHRDFEHNNRERNKDSDYRQRDRDEVEWEGRRGNNNSWDPKQFDDKSQGRKDRKLNDNFHKPQSTPFGDDREMDRPQRPESRDRPARPDSRDSRASRESRNSRETLREENSRSIPDSNVYNWNMGDYDKESKEEKLRKKEFSKEEKREVVSRREGHVPGPITREKMFAYDLMHENLSKTDKKEIIGTSLINSVPDEDTRNKLAPMGTSMQLNSHDDGWSEQDGGPQGMLSKDYSIQPLASMGVSDDADKSGALKDDFDKKKDGGLKDKDGKNVRGGRGPRNSRQGGERPYNSNSNNFFHFILRNNGGPTNYPKENNRRRGQGKGGQRDKGQLGSDSDASLDEISASTESGKEDKKSDRRQLPRSSRSGERKKDKDDRNYRETKKIENEKNSGSRKHGSGSLSSGGGGGYEMNRREGFAPRGEPSRRGRGGYRPGGRGALANVGGHYGPPGSKSPFPQANQAHHLDMKDDDDVSRTGNEKPLDSDHLSSDADKSKSSNKQHQGNLTGGNRTPKESRKNDGVRGKVRSKTGSGEDRDSTSDGGSDSDVKKHPRNLQKMDKNKSNQRTAGEKRTPYNNTAHMNGRPSRSDEGKDNGFQEVKGKKVGKESRPLSRGRKDGKGKGPLGSGNGSGPQQKNNPTSKTFQRERSNNPKPPRLQQLENVRKAQMAQQQDVSEMNKINQNPLPLFPSTIRDVNCSMTPAPPPTKSAWEKPITAALRASSPTNTLHLASSISNPSEKSMEIPDHVQSGTSSQTSSPSAEKVMSAKLGREVDKGMLDGATPPVQTIIFENTNYKTPELAMKSKYSLKPNQRIDKGRGKLEDDLDGATHGIGGLSFKTGVDLKSCDNKTQESLQMPMTFKNEDNADMKLDFPFDSDLSQLTEDKTNIPRSTYLGQSSAELNQKIASVKKVWDTAGSAMEHQHHVDEVHVVSTSSSSFTPNFVGAVDSALDHASAHQVDDNAFNNADVYSAGMQGGSGSYSSSAAGMMKADPNPSGGIKPQPQQAAVMSTSIGTHSSQSLSSPPPPFNQTGHFSYQAQYGGISTIPSPPAVLVNSQGAQVPTNSQDFVQQHPYPFSSPMIGNQTPRSNYSQQPAYPYNLTQNLTQNSFSQPQSAVYIPTQQAANPTPELFSTAYRLQATFGQSPQINNNPSAVLITSSTSNSLMSASVKSAPQQPPPPLGAIGTKAGFQNSQIPLGYMSYEPHSIIPNYAPLVTQRHAAGNPPSMPPSTSFYSGSTGGPGAFSSLLGTNNQSMHTATTAFSMQSFSNQSAANPGGAPPSSNVGHPSFGSMSHFRTTYMKPTGPGQHQPDASKSPSANQDLSNSVFSPSSGGGQIPSPKSRSAGGSNSSSGGKQVSVSPQQPSPTQTHHKFPSYPQQNLVGQQPPPNSQPGAQRSGSQLGGGVRSNSGNGGAGLNNSVHVYPPPGPIQRPGPASYQTNQHKQSLQFQALAAHQQQQQQRHRVQAQQATSRPPQQPHVKPSYVFIQQVNPVKMETRMEGKGDASSNSSNSDPKDEVSD